MSVTITEILGTDSISGSRLTINSNFLLLENAYNDLENTFNINVLTGSLDVSSASSGQIKAKSMLSNSMVMPSSGSPNIQIYGTGASAGFMVASSTVASATGIFSNLLQANTLSASGAATFGATASFQGVLNNNGPFTVGASGNFINTNRKATVGINTAFPSAPGAGVTGSYSSPYIPTLTESVIYIQSDYVSPAPADVANSTGFFFYATTGFGATASSIPAGFTLTFVDVATTTSGIIATGVTGPGGSEYYTGFSTGDGSYTDPNITAPGNQYKSSLTLMWEPRIDQNALTQKGSWIVVNAVGNFAF
jgi:hypothetical protein